MKKIMTALFLLMLALSFSTVAMAGCSEHPDAEEYNRSYFWYDEPWNDTYHRSVYVDDMVCKECEAWVSGGDVIFLEEHDFSGDKCRYCGYVRTGLPTYEELQREAVLRITEDAASIIGKTAIVVHNGNLRAEASQHSADLGAVISDDEYEIVSYQLTAENNVWLEIKYANSTAWVSASLVKISGAAALDNSFASAYIDRTCKIKVSSGRARLAPGKKSPEISYVRYGEMYTILDAQSAADGTLWFQIKVDGGECWISSGLADVY